MTNYATKTATRTIIMLFCCVMTSQIAAQEFLIDADSQKVLVIPQLSDGLPSAGKRVRITPVEYEGTEVFHTIFLPKKWTTSSKPIPIIFELTGNFHPASGSSGEPEDGGLGYCLSAGKYIWVSLPYISKDKSDNAVTWWGDEKATVEYAKRNVPKIIQSFGADPTAVFLCGFSRGAIGVNFIGLHDDEISKLWTAFVSHDHFDGIRAWGNTKWGSPLAKYRQEALVRLKRVGNRPYLVSQNGSKYGTKSYLKSNLEDVKNFTFNDINAKKIFGKFPNEYVKSGHTDRWAIVPSPERTKVWHWMNRISKGSRK